MSGAPGPTAPFDPAALVVRRMDAERRADFARLHAEETGCGWCQCVAWWIPTWEHFGERTAEENRRFRADLFDRGEYDGYLGYLGELPVAWCQVGPRDRLRKLVQNLALEPDPEVWAITCFLVAPTHRGKGVSGALLRAVLADLRSRGVRRVEAYPRAVGVTDFDALEQWTGPEALFLGAGFHLVRRASPRSVFALETQRIDSLLDASGS